MLFSLIAAALVATVPPHEGAAKPIVNPTPASTSVAVVAAMPVKPTRYCFLHVQEDSIYRGKVCKTRKQWLWQGVDPFDYPARKK
ncbi:hypothetical protein [Sphingomonas sp.]|uniref:hypothetical protein n=1 Tax=Sphingomonas sp. TaxID=28214 RepID=UPI0031DE6875